MMRTIFLRPHCAKVKEAHCAQITQTSFNKQNPFTNVNLINVQAIIIVQGYFQVSKVPLWRIERSERGLDTFQDLLKKKPNIEPGLISTGCLKSGSSKTEKFEKIEIFEKFEKFRKNSKNFGKFDFEKFKKFEKISFEKVRKNLKNEKF